MSRPPKPWFRKFTSSWYVMIDGKQHPLGPDKDEAFRLFHELMADRPQLNQKHIAVILDKFLDWTQAHRATRTYEWYRDFLQSFKDAHPSLKVDQLKPYHVDEWASKGPKRARITAMKRAMNWAAKQGYIDHSPIAQMDRPEVGKRTQTISPDEFQTLLSKIRDQAFRDLLEFSWEAGTRPQESKRLEARHLELDKSRCVIPADEAKGSKPRVIYLTDKAIEILKRLAAAYPEGSLFRNRDGNRWTANAVRCRFKRLEPKIGQRFTQYAFRHTWISRKLVAGVDSRIVAKLAGHTSTRELDRTYSHIADDYEFMLRHARRDVTEDASNDND